MSGCGKEVEVWKEEYSKGKMKEEYQYYHHPETNRRMKDGEWSSFTEDGKETKRIYENGKKDRGEFRISVKQDTLRGWVETDDEIRDEDEVFRGLFTYDDGVWNGLGVLYWENGNKRGEGLYEDGQQEGYYKKFYSSGEVKGKGNYVDGKSEGKWVGYYESGEVDWEGTYVDGKLEGVFGRLWNRGCRILPSKCTCRWVANILQPLSTLIEVRSRMVVIPSVYNEYRITRTKKPLRSM